MGGVAISTAGTQAQFGITSVKTGILSDRLALSGRNFSLHCPLYGNLCKQTPGLIVKAEHGSQKPQSSPILTISDPLHSTEKQEVFSSKAKRANRKTKASSLVKAAAIKKGSSCTIPTADIDYSKAAEKLEHIYNDSPASVSGSDLETSEKLGITESERRKTKSLDLNAANHGTSSEISITDAISSYIKPKEVGNGTTSEQKSKRILNNMTAQIVRSARESKKRLSLDVRIALRKAKLERMQCKDQTASQRKNKVKISNEDLDFWCKGVDEMIKSYSMSMIPLDWKRLPARKLLSPAEHICLAKLMKPMKLYFQKKQDLRKDLRREPTDNETAASLKLPVHTFRRHVEAGQAARNKLIQHNLRLVLFEVNKYILKGSGLGFEDACLQGAKGLIIAVDRFEPDKDFRLSTYAMYWIRHAILRAMTLSSLMRTTFAVAALKHERQRTTLDLLLELGRPPTGEEIRSKMGLERERYKAVARSCRKASSLDNCNQAGNIPELQNVGYPAIRPEALLRLGLDDVLDSLKPKESLVIRQRFGLDGKGQRSLGEIASNLNISREMVRKHEVKAMLKLKHPARVEYVRGFLSP